MSKLDNLLSRLQKVKRTGKDSHIALCPCHQDKSPSLTIRELEPDHILVNCFAGCETYDVLGSIGLTFDDVYPDRVKDEYRKPEQIPFNPRDVLSALHGQAIEVLMFAKDIQKGKVLTEKESLELSKVIGRIGLACELARAK
jgi:hypothetical protein